MVNLSEVINLNRSTQVFTVKMDADIEDVQEVYRADQKQKALVSRSARQRRRGGGFAHQAGATSGDILLHVDI
jgi:hypothetical protein